MRLLIFVALVVAATALPRKPNKLFPKKFDSAVHGVKDTYIIYEILPDQELVVPAEHAFLDTLLPPSSYDSYYEQEPQDPILPPEGSTYTGVGDAEGEEDLVPPPEDTYSNPDGTAVGGLVPPPEFPQEPEGEKSYVTFEGEGEDALAPPSLSSYAVASSDKAGADVLASLVSMIHSLPLTSSYSNYNPVVVSEESSPEAPSLFLQAPPAEAEPRPQKSSFSEIPKDQPAYSPEVIAAAKEANIPVPSFKMEPPTI